MEDAPAASPSPGGDSPSSPAEGSAFSRFMARNTPAPGEDGASGTNTPVGSGNPLPELLARSRLDIAPPLDPGNAILTQSRLPSGPTAIDTASAKYAALTSRGFLAPRSGLGAGISTAMRVSGAALPSGFTGPQAASMNGISTGNVARQWGNQAQRPQVTPSASSLGAGTSQLQRAQGYVTAPRPGQ
jgi:hypothetical protein